MKSRLVMCVLLAGISTGCQKRKETIFLADAETGRGLRQPTIRKYKLLFRRLNEHFKNKGYVFLTRVTADDLREFRNTWKMSPRTAGKYIERMKTFLKFALDFN